MVFVFAFAFVGKEDVSSVEIVLHFLWDNSQHLRGIFTNCLFVASEESFDLRKI